MDSNVINNKMKNAAKWNSISELIAKLFVPITNIILARVLLPEEFGVVASIMMFITLVDLISESGFQKYLIKTKFNNKLSLEEHLNVAFSVNLMISLGAIAIIFLFKQNIGILLGDITLIKPLLLATTLLIISSLSSIQIALFKKNLDFKTLGLIRMVSVLLPLLVTLPMAIIGMSYWAIIIGKITSDVLSLFLLQWNSSWRPRFFYSQEIFTKMIKTSSWALAETLLMWFTTYIGVFYLTIYFSAYYVGIYRTAMVSTDGILVTLYMPLLSVMYSSMSVKEKLIDKLEIFKKFHQVITMFLFPMSVGIFLYKEVVSNILLGANWIEAPMFIGAWALSTMLYVTMGTAFYELYRSNGDFKTPVVIHIIYASIYVLILIWIKPQTFSSFVVLNVGIRAIILPIINLILYIKKYEQSFFSLIKTEWVYMLGTLLIYIVSTVLFHNRLENNIITNIAQIFCNVIVYILTLLLVKSSRHNLRVIFK